MHKSLVFLSCGQREGERQLAKAVEDMIVNELSMRCYNADSVHGADDVMSITEHLAVADYYIMIDFARESSLPVSIFTHQEFALARAWGLDKMLVFQEEGLSPHGMLGYVLAHPIRFRRDELVEVVRSGIETQNWDPHYSRNLVAATIQASDHIVLYGDHTGSSQELVWWLEIANKRADKAAVNAVAILHSVLACGDGSRIDSPDRSYLKWVYQKEGYQHTILPDDHAGFDAFAIRVNQAGVYLHSRHDHSPRRPIIADLGEYVLTYHVYSSTFPLLAIPIRLRYTGPLLATLRGTETTASIEATPGDGVATSAEVEGAN